MRISTEYDDYNIVDLLYKDYDFKLYTPNGYDYVFIDQIRRRVETLRSICLRLLYNLGHASTDSPIMEYDDDIWIESIPSTRDEKKIPSILEEIKHTYPITDVEISNFYMYLENERKWRTIISFYDLYKDFRKAVFDDMNEEQKSKSMIAVAYSKLLCKYDIKIARGFNTIIPLKWTFRLLYGDKIVDYIDYMYESKRIGKDDMNDNIIIETERYLRLYDQNLIYEYNEKRSKDNTLKQYKSWKKSMSSSKSDTKDNGGFKMNQKQLMGTIWVTVAFIVVMLLVYMCTYRIGPGFAGVIYNANGGVQEDTLSQGWHVVFPWQSVIEYPVSTETVSYSKSNGNKDSKDTSINVNTKDGKQVNVDVNYTYRMDQTLLPQIFTNFRGRKYTDIEDTIMKNAMYQAVNEVTSQYNLMELVSDKRSEVNNKIFSKYKDALAEDGIILETFNLSDIKPDDATEQAIQNVVNAQNALAQSKIEKERAEVEAEKLRVAAKGKADATLIEAEGQAAANEKLRQSLTPEVIQYNQIQKWNGTLPQYMLGENTGVFITPNK